jgi:hypothetical protein
MAERRRWFLVDPTVPRYAKLSLASFYAAVFDPIAWAIFLYPGWRIRQEWEATHSPHAPRGAFMAERCESSRYSASCTGTFMPAGTGRRLPRTYHGDLDALGPHSAATMPDSGSVWLIGERAYL